MTTTIETIIVIAILVFWACLSLSLLLGTIQSIVYEKKREKREQEYHAERMKRLN